MKFLGNELRNFFTNFDSSKADDLEAIPESYLVKVSIVSDSDILIRSNSDSKVFWQGFVQQPHGKAVLLLISVGSWINHIPGFVDAQDELHTYCPHCVVGGIQHWASNRGCSDLPDPHRSRTNTTIISFSV